MNTKKVEDLCDVLRKLGSRGLTQATSGNHSCRVDQESFWITRSGFQKSEATVSDFLLVGLNGSPIVENTKNKNNEKPSDECGLHSLIYQRDSQAGVIFHVHSVHATVMSLLLPTTDSILLSGYEMQKAFYGCTSHEEQVRLPVFSNTQKIPELVTALSSRWNEVAQHKSFYIRGHGIYCWETSIAKARAALEAWEFLFEVETLRRIAM
jgi:methylthioribulose-1-phosphate dehydratase